MNQIARCGWLPERARLSYLPLGTTRRVPEKNFPESQIINPLFSDQTFSVKMAEYWPHSFLQVMDFDSFSVHKLAKKELGQYPAILTSRLVNNPYIQF